MTIRIGIDVGGTKIAAIALDARGRSTSELRRPTPRNDYQAAIRTIVDIVTTVRAEATRAGLSNRAETAFTVGIGIPGSIARTTGNVQNANSTWLNGRPLQEDLTDAIGQTVRIENDANCFALSEANDGVASDASTVFGVILGTGCGGGLVINRQLRDGPRGIAGEWGHIPLPAPDDDERPGPRCWCGRDGCLETWISGPGLEADYRQQTGQELGAETIAIAAQQGDENAAAALDRHADRTARGLALVVNLLDPDVIVLGGGLSNLASLYTELPRLIAPHIFAADRTVDIRRPKWGDASGVRGAARLWDQPH